MRHRTVHAPDRGSTVSAGEMAEWLQASTGARIELCDALLGAWVGTLRYALLSQVRLDRALLARVVAGRGTMRLNRELTPEGWSDAQLWAMLSHETGLLHREAAGLLHSVRERLYELAKEGSIFRPLGTISLTGDGQFEVQLDRGFLQGDTGKTVELESSESARDARPVAVALMHA